MEPTYPSFRPSALAGRIRASMQICASTRRVGWLRRGPRQPKRGAAISRARRARTTTAALRAGGIGSWPTGRDLTYSLLAALMASYCDMAYEDEARGGMEGVCEYPRALGRGPRAVGARSPTSHSEAQAGLARGARSALSAQSSSSASMLGTRGMAQHRRARPLPLPLSPSSPVSPNRYAMNALSPPLLAVGLSGDCLTGT